MCFVQVHKTLHSCSTSLHPDVLIGIVKLYRWGGGGGGGETGG